MTPCHNITPRTKPTPRPVRKPISNSRKELPAPGSPLPVRMLIDGRIRPRERGKGRDDPKSTQLAGTGDKVAAGSLGGVHGLIRAAEQGVEVIVAGPGEGESDG